MYFADSNQNLPDGSSNNEIKPQLVRNSVKKGKRSCPYLGTINRHLLDFDFEKLCSICMSNQHVYACLVCGRFFQGRGKGTYCYTHSLEEKHYVFMNLSDCLVYCLPENYLVDDTSLDDIRFYLNPRYSKQEVDEIDVKATYGKSLDGSDFIPGYIGLNNLKNTDYFNVIVQMLLKITPIRNSLLLLDLSKKQSPDSVVLSLGELARKMYNHKNFKGIVSPHEFLQAIGVASQKKFRIGVQKDPLALFSWLINRLSSKLKSTSGNVIDETLKGELLVRSSNLENGIESQITETRNKFLFLTLTPPDAPIFKDSLDRNMIPQVPIFELLKKFDGTSEHEVVPGTLKRYSLSKLPPFLILQIKRFSKNNFFIEKNPTIVTFPVKNLDLSDYVHPDAHHENPVARYNLIANICHQGQPHNGIYKIHVLHSALDEWFEIEDLRVTPVLPQFVALSESYVQLYKRQDIGLDGKVDELLKKQALDGSDDDLQFSFEEDEEDMFAT